MNSQKYRYSQNSIKPKSFFITPAEIEENTSRQPSSQRRPKHAYSNSHDYGNNSFDLSNPLRVPSHIQAVVSSLFKKLTTEDKQKISQRIEKNKDLAVMNKNVKQEIARKKYFQNQIRANITKITKKNIEKEKKAHKENMLKEKFKKFQYRMNITDVKGVVKSWLFLTALVGISNASRHLMINKKRLRARSLKLLVWLKAVCRAIARFVILRWNIKKRQSMRKLRILFVPVVKKWIRRRRKFYRKVLVNVLEQQLSIAVLMKLVKFWQIKMLFLKNQIRKFIEFQRNMYDALVIQWNRTEHLMFDSDDDGKRRRRNTVALKSIRNLNSGCTSIPDDLKIYYLRSKIKEILNIFLESYRDYKIRFNYVHHKNMDNRWSRNPDLMLDYPVRPQTPKLFEFFTVEQLTHLINDALKDRGMWNKHMELINSTHKSKFIRYQTQFNS